MLQDNSEKAITVRADLKAASKILLKIKRMIALGKFNIGKYLDDPKDNLMLLDLQSKFLEHREKLAHIGQISTATYEHDKLS